MAFTVYCCTGYLVQVYTPAFQPLDSKGNQSFSQPWKNSYNSVLCGNPLQALRNCFVIVSLLFPLHLIHLCPPRLLSLYLCTKRAKACYAVRHSKGEFLSHERSNIAATWPWYLPEIFLLSTHYILKFTKWWAICRRERKWIKVDNNIFKSLQVTICVLKVAQSFRSGLLLLR